MALNIFLKWISHLRTRVRAQGKLLVRVGRKATGASHIFSLENPTDHAVESPTQSKNVEA